MLEITLESVETTAAIPICVFALLSNLPSVGSFYAYASNNFSLLQKIIGDLVTVGNNKADDT